MMSWMLRGWSCMRPEIGVAGEEFGGSDGVWMVYLLTTVQNRIWSCHLWEDLGILERNITTY